MARDKLKSEGIPSNHQFSDYQNWYWRQGRRNARVIYAMVDRNGRGPNDIDDIMIGSFDSGVIAQEAVVAHNERKAIRDNR